MESNFETKTVKIKSIRIVPNEDVYDITVNDNHNFFANGLVVHNCGEQVLPVGGVCLLGSINLTQFVNAERNGWNYDKLKELVPIAVRFMDNVNDITHVPLQSQKQNLQNKRRIGLGVLGYGSALLMMQTKYGSEKAKQLTDELMEFISNTAYCASSDIAAEKGSFLLFDADKYLEGEFVKVLKPETREKIRKQGLRNSHLLSIQPTGNSSVYANNVSGGLEPLFSFEYIRTTIFPYPPSGLDVPKHIDFGNKTFQSTTEWKWTKEGDENLLYTEFEGYVWKFDQNRGLLRETQVKDYAVRDLQARGAWDPSAEWAANAMVLDINSHVETMAIFAKYVDSALSKTINIPTDYSYEDFKSVYTDTYKTGTIKGITTYRAGTMTSVLAEISSKKEETESISKTKAPKRPKILNCDINHLMVNGDPWIVIVGLFGKDPYEIFAFKKTKVHFSHRWTTGTLTRVKKGVYTLTVGDNDIVIEDITANFESDEQEALTRMVSTALRHGADVNFIFEQLMKSEGTIVSFSKAVARTLKKYIVTDETAPGKDCEECGGKSTVIMQEGCFKCKNCAHSKC